MLNYINASQLCFRREHFPDSSWDTSLDASYKSIDEDHRDQRDQREHQRAGRYDTSETVPLVLRRTGERPPSVSNFFANFCCFCS